MPSPEPFTFGIALMPRASARSWPLVEALLDLTLTSVRAQTDPDFRVVIAGHDRPRSTTALGDPRVTFLEADWPAQEPEPRNADRGRKKHAINELVLDRGGGLLMFLDADDWVDARLVAAARAAIGPGQVGALIDAGFAADFQTLRAAALPHPRVFAGGFHRLCGSSAVARLRPDAADPLRRDPWNVMDAHHRWVEVAREHGAELARLPVAGTYVINTSENHSEVHGPYALWRRTFTEGVNREGSAIDGALAARFGLSLDRVRAASERFFPRVDSRRRRPTPTALMPATVPPDAPPAARREEGMPSSPCLMPGRPVSPPPDASRAMSHRPTFGPGLAAADRGGRRIVLVSTMRNEGPFILEWIAYHLAVGFTDIVICTNDCVDESPLLLDRLQELGLVAHVANEVGPGEEPQLVAYRRAEELPAVRDADWAMVLDADEFLNIHVGGGTVPDLLDAVPDATAFLLNWRIFGHSGHEEWRPGFVCERFTRAAALGDAVNLSFKTLFTKIDAYHCKLLPHGPGYADEVRLPELRYVNGAGITLPRYFVTSQTFLQSEPELVSWKLAQVNHYNTRSREDYVVKHHRGGGLARSWDRDWGWAAFNKNDETDLTIANKLATARAIFGALLRDDALRRRHERCCDLYRGHVAALKRQQRLTSAAGAG
jgi:hypothetical protein